MRYVRVAAGGRDICVAQEALGELEVARCADKAGGGCMAEVMEAEVSDVTSDVPTPYGLKAVGGDRVSLKAAAPVACPLG